MVLTALTKILMYKKYINMSLTIGVMSDQSMSDEVYTSSCPYCGETFEAETQMKADNREGVHRTEEHVDRNGQISREVDGKNNVADEWRRKKMKEDATSTVHSDDEGSESGSSQLVEDWKDEKSAEGVST